MEDVQANIEDIMSEFKDLNKIKIFNLLAEKKSFTKVAQAFGLTKSRIWRQIEDLEKKLDCQLFEVDKKEVFLTSKGEVAYEHFRKLQQKWELSLNLIQSNLDEFKGEFKLHCSTIFSALWAGKCLKGFLEKYPDLSLKLIGYDTIPNLLLGETDIFIGPYLKEQPNIIQKKLKPYHLRLYASKDYLAQYGTPKSINELHRHKIIAFGNYNQITQLETVNKRINWHLNYPSNLIKPHVLVSNGLAMLNMIASSIGIGSSSPEAVKSNGYKLINVLPEFHGSEIAIYLSFNQVMENARFINTLHDHIRKIM